MQQGVILVLIFGASVGGAIHGVQGGCIGLAIASVGCFVWGVMLLVAD
jgi:hypothetical protein